MRDAVCWKRHATAIEDGTVLQDEYLLGGPVDDHDGHLHYATHLATTRPVVVRFWRSDDAVAVQRVLERLELTSRIRHPALATLEAFGRGPDGRVFLVSERVLGEPLDRWADRSGIPPLPSVIELAQRLCVGLNAAHRNGLAHDALNPRNVLVTADPQEPARIGGKLLDLGVPARMRAWPPSLGGARFMAPEQLARALRADEAALGADVAMNVYSCGSLLYYLCTGGAPFLGRNLEELAHAHAAQRLVPPSKINPQIPGNLQAVILRALSFAPEARFASMSELNAALGGVRASGTSGVHEVGQPRSAVGPRPRRERHQTRDGFEERPTSEMSIPPSGAASRPPSPPPLPSDAPKPRRSSAPLGSFSGLLPLAPTDEPRASESAPPPTRAEPPRLLPLSALLAEPLAIEPAPLDAIVVRSDGGHAIQPQRTPLPVTPRRRVRLTLASASALGFALAASAASAYVVLHPRFSAQGTAPRARSTASAPVDATSVRRAAVPKLVAPAVVVESPQPVPELAAPELAMRAREPRRRSAPPPIRSAPARAVERPGGVLHIRAVEATDESTENHGPLHAATSVEPLPAAPDDSEPLAAFDAGAIAGVAASAAHAAAQPVDAASPPPALARTQARPRPSAPLVATPDIRELAVRGSLATSEVRRALDRIRPQLAACYARAARAAGRNGYGELRLEVELDERGRAHAPNATGSSLPGLERCLERAASKLAARPPDTGTVKATWKVVFEP